MQGTETALDLDPNGQLKAYLRQYLEGTVPPQHAVLLCGNWGSGKTFLIQDFLRTLKSDEDEQQSVYVSLYGLQNADEIDQALLAQLHPALGLVKLGAEAVFKHFGAKGIDVAKLANRFSAKLYVFDDLERCRAPIDVSMGYINRFVEQGDRKVIILANEREIRRKKRYARVKEKLVGRTFEVRTSFHQVFATFLGQLGPPRVQDHIKSKRADIEAIYSASETNNFRTLRQTLWDYSQLLSIIPDAHLDHAEASSVLARTLFSLAFELKSGRLLPDHILVRGTAGLRLAMSDVAKSAKGKRSDAAWRNYRKRYPDVDLRDGLLDDSTWHEILVNGVVKPNQLLDSMNNGRFFADKRSWPSWRVMWNLYDFTQNELEQVQPLFEADFRARRFVHAGEVLHAFGIRALMHHIGVDKRKAEKVLRDCEQYTDDLVVLPAFDPLAAEAYVREESYQNLGYAQANSEIFAKARQYFDEKRKEEVGKRAPGWASELLEEIERDARSFAYKITSSTYEHLGNVPLLHHIKAKDFALAVAALPSPSQQFIFEGLKERYRRVGREDLLKYERPWLIQLRTQLEKVAKRQPPLAKYRLMSRARNTLADLAVGSAEGN